MNEPQTALTDNQWEILSDLASASQGLSSTKQWLRCNELSGPVRSAQRTALRQLMARNLIERRERMFRANRNVTYEYRITSRGLTVVEAEQKEREQRYARA